MPHYCCVTSCKNSVAKGYRLFKIPTNAKRKQIWLDLIARPNLHSEARICEVHFSEEQFESTRLDGRKLLKSFAVPDMLHSTSSDNSEAQICEVPFSEEQFESARLDGRKLLKPCAVPDVSHSTSSGNKRKCEEVHMSSKLVMTNESEVTAAESSTSNDVSLDVSYENTEYSNNDASHEESLLNCLTDDDELDNELLTSPENAEDLVGSLRKTVKSLSRKCRYYEKKLKQREPTNLEKIFNLDQLEFLETDKRRGTVWSDDTITRGLKLYMACGTEGYKELLNQGLPYPSIRTLQHCLRNLKFKPGILDDVLQILKLRMENLKPEERHAVLIFDEMAIKSGLQYDNSLSMVVGRPTIGTSDSKDLSNQLATHGLVFMLAGVSSRWKQIIGYEFSANSINADELYNIIVTIIQKCHEMNIIIRAVTSDMGPQNRGLWKKLGLAAGKINEIRNFIQHPCLPNNKLFFAPDPVHVFKNIAGALTKGHKFILEDALVERYGLPSNIVSIESIKLIFEFEKGDVIKLCPRLKESVLNPTHFDKMNVSLSVALISHDVAAAISYYIIKNKLNPEHQTTAWFLTQMEKWFKLMSGRYHAFALDPTNEEKYMEAINFLTSVQELFYCINVNGTWKPYQTGVIMATQTALDFQKTYLEEYNYKYVMLGRLVQDSIENSFSMIRKRQPIPDARLFKVSLRLVCLSQFQSSLKKTSYSDSEANDLVSYCNDLNNVLSKSHEQVEDEIMYEMSLVINENSFVAETKSDIQSSIYYLLGSIILKINKNFTHCEHCYEAVQTNPDEINDLNLFTKLKEFKENALIFPTLDLFKYICKLETEYRLLENQIISNKLTLDKFLFHINNTYTAPTIPTCHQILKKIVKLYVRSHVYFHLKSTIDPNTSTGKDSRSMAMRINLR